MHEHHTMTRQIKQEFRRSVQWESKSLPGRRSKWSEAVAIFGENFLNLDANYPSRVFWIFRMSNTIKNDGYCYLRCSIVTLTSWYSSDVNIPSSPWSLQWTSREHRLGTLLPNESRSYHIGLSLQHTQYSRDLHITWLFTIFPVTLSQWSISLLR